MAETAAARARRERALGHVAALAPEGPPLPGGLRVTLNFHPDRSCRGVPVLQAMAEDGTYRSQFATGTSNGGLTAHPGGDRWRWESRLFGGAYDGCPPRERPVYGALNFRHRPVGAAPRFGSAHFRLRPEASARATYCYPDSSTDPGAVATAGRMSLLALAANDPSRPDLLDDYVEAHVHGPVLFSRDVEALVMDPCYRSTPVEEQARALGCPVEWHPGFRAPVTELARHPEFRGAAYVELARELAGPGGLLDPGIIGAAVEQQVAPPQDLKKVWHYLARFSAGVYEPRLPADALIRPGPRHDGPAAVR
ncbi:DUF3626 domain-containing protein [Streptomyces albidoflavus]|uniref:DUF3626 domain-containing protein n=1 Tax=Streptomyces albidoflavus TaxID=1886 RepID=UPI00352C0BB0|nr:DUF3626 domain-containing protein [Streptomyces albidoflavus]